MTFSNYEQEQSEFLSKTQVCFPFSYFKWRQNPRRLQPPPNYVVSYHQGAVGSPSTISLIVTNFVRTTVFFSLTGEYSALFRENGESSVRRGSL